MKAHSLGLLIAVQGRGELKKIELFHPEVVVQNSQARRLSNAEVPGKRFA